jgi:hypothetical protein
MPNTLGIMLTFTTYGTWLRGDARGWVADGLVYPPEPRLEDMDRQRLRYPPFRFSPEQRHQAGNAIGRTVAAMGGSVYALTVGSWHAHVVVGYVNVPLAEIVKLVKEGVRIDMGYRRAIWSDGYDKRFCFDRRSLLARVEYVRRHNLQDGLPGEPWAFIVPPI